jgi:hypothetical protein
MAFNDKKILNILNNHVDDLDEKCVGYKDKMRDLVKDIIRLETEHSVSKTNIKQKLHDSIQKVGKFLKENDDPSENGDL